MAATAAYARVSGPVLNLNRRQGIGKASGQPYDFTVVSVLVGARGITEFTWPKEDIAGPLPTRGEMVDLFVEITSSEFGLRITPIGSGANLDGESLSLLEAIAS